jgi:hypothetical protein
MVFVFMALGIVGSFLDFEHVFLLIFMQNLIGEVEPKLGLALVRVATWDLKLYCSWKGVQKKGLVGEEWGKKSCLGGEDDTSLQCVLELELGT